MTRNPLDVAKSLQRINGWPVEVGLKMWFAYCFAALFNFSNAPILSIHFEDITASPSECLKSLDLFLNFKRKCLKRTEHEFVDFIKADFAHFSSSISDLELACTNLPEVVMLYSELHSIGSGVVIDSSIAISILQKIIHQFPDRLGVIMNFVTTCLSPVTLTFVAVLQNLL